MPIIREIDFETGEAIDRPLTDQELAQLAEMAAIEPPSAATVTQPSSAQIRGALIAAGNTDDQVAALFELARSVKL